MKLRYFGPLALTWAVLVASASADVVIVPPPQPPGERPSHRPIAGGLESNMTPEQLLARRLAGSRGKLGEEKLDDDMKALFGKLLQDKDFIASLSKSLKPEDLARMKDSLGDTKRFADDPTLKKLVEGMKDDPALKKLVEGMKSNKLTDQDRDLLQRWNDNAAKKDAFPQPQVPPTPLGPDGQPMPSQPPIQPGQLPTLPPVQQPRPNDLKLPDWAKKNLDQSARDFTRWLDTPNGKVATDRFRDAAKRFAEARNNSAVRESVKGIGRHFPRPGNWMLNRMPPRPSPNFGALPRLPSAGAMPSVSADGATRVLVVVVVVGVLLFVLWHSRNWVKETIAARLAKTWKLGPWPVRPDRISTRADLVSAFEYLALLCLGPEARAHHHHDLGRQIGAQPSLDPDRRRDAAETLARLYEQARYTPDDEPLSPTDLADARRELTLLAGEQAA